MRDKTVAILESRLGPQMADLIARRGGAFLQAPALAELPALAAAYIAKRIGELRTWPAKLAIFQAGVGTQALFKATDAQGLTDDLLALLAKTTVAARGPKPSGALRARAVRIDLQAADPFTTAELLQAVGSVPFSGARVIVQRYGVTNFKLDEALKSIGAATIATPHSRRDLPRVTPPPITYPV